MHFLVFCIFAYLLGSIPFGKLVGQSRGINIQKEGSGNIGFANSLRVMGYGPALVVLGGDVFKGYLAVRLALTSLDTSHAATVGLAVILGHITSPWLGFRGGKGVATLVGVALALDPILGLGTIVVWGVVFAVTRITSIASLTIVILLPLISWWRAPSLTPFFMVALTLILCTHRANIKNLSKGTERKIR